MQQRKTAELVTPVVPLSSAPPIDLPKLTVPAGPLRPPVPTAITAPIHAAKASDVTPPTIFSPVPTQGTDLQNLVTLSPMPSPAQPAPQVPAGEARQNLYHFSRICQPPSQDDAGSKLSAERDGPSHRGSSRCACRGCHFRRTRWYKRRCRTADWRKRWRRLASSMALGSAMAGRARMRIQAEARQPEKDWDPAPGTVGAAGRMEVQHTGEERFQELRFKVGHRRAAVILILQVQPFLRCSRLYVSEGIHSSLYGQDGWRRARCLSGFAMRQNLHDLCSNADGQLDLRILPAAGCSTITVQAVGEHACSSISGRPDCSRSYRRI